MDKAITTTDSSATDGYETPELTEFGSIEEWTQGTYAQLVTVSIII